MPSRPAPRPVALRVLRNNGKREACSPGRLTKGLAGLPHEVDTHTRQEAALGMAVRPAQSEAGVGHATDSQRQAGGRRAPSWPRPRPWHAGASGTLWQADLLADPGSEGGGGGRETLLWFCGQGGNILRIFRGWIGNWPHSPQALPARAQPLEHAI